MTLRVWAFLLLVGLIILVTQGAEAQVSEPLVWTQMQEKPNQTLRGVVKGLELNGDRVIVELASSDGLKKLQLCSDPAQIPFDRPRADKIELLRDAYKSGEAVELGLTGPWSPCLNTVRVSKGA